MVFYKFNIHSNINIILLILLIFTNTILHAQILQDKCFSELQKRHLYATITLPRIRLLWPYPEVTKT